FSLDADGFWQLHNEVRLADGPFFREVTRLRRICRITPGSVAGQPDEEVLFVLRRKGDVIQPRGVLALRRRRSEPGWHDSALHLLSDHACVFDDVLIALQAEGTDGIFAMALHATRLHQTRD